MNYTHEIAVGVSATHENGRNPLIGTVETALAYLNNEALRLRDFGASFSNLKAPFFANNKQVYPMIRNMLGFATCASMTLTAKAMIAGTTLILQNLTIVNDDCTVMQKTLLNGAKRMCLNRKFELPINEMSITR